MILRGTVFSHILEMETGITVIVPAPTSTDQPYGVVYLLHGLCGRSGDLVDYTMLPVFADSYHAILVMPEVARSFYTDMVYGLRYFTYITEELPDICRHVFQITAERDRTAIMGSSMGGYGALKCALSRPDQYGGCAAFSSACLFLKEFMDNQLQEDGGQGLETICGKQLACDFRAAFGEHLKIPARNDIPSLARNIDNRPVKPRIYCTCGSEDGFRPEHLRFRDEMQKLHYDFTYEEWQGKHDWTFFNESYRRALAWYFGPQEMSGQT